MVWVPGGSFPMGSERLLSRGTPGAPGRGRRVLDGRAPGDGGRVPPVRDGDRLRDRGRAPARPGRVPGRGPRPAAPGSLVFLATAGRWTCGTWRSGGGTPRAPTGAIPAGRAARRAAWTGTRSPTWPPRTPTRTPPGRARSCPPRPSGSSPPAAGWTGRSSPGATSSAKGRVMANTWQGEFPWHNLKPPAARARRRCGASRRTATASTTWPATCGSGRATTSPRSRGQPAARPCCAPRNPRVTDPGGSLVPGEPGAHIPRRVIKGGSHLCAPNYCLRYRPAARQGEAVDTSTAHLGFRCVSARQRPYGLRRRGRGMAPVPDPEQRVGDRPSAQREPVRGEPVGQCRQHGLARVHLGQHQEPGEAGFHDPQAAGRDGDHPDDAGYRVGDQDHGGTRVSPGGPQRGEQAQVVERETASGQQRRLPPLPAQHGPDVVALGQQGLVQPLQRRAFRK